MCRWVARGHSELNGRRFPTRSPVADRSASAYEELIEADRLAMRSPRPQHLLRHPGRIEGICAALHWAWRRDAPPPITVPDSDAPEAGAD